MTADEIFAAVEARPKRKQGGVCGQTIEEHMRGTVCQITEYELDALREETARLIAEVEKLTVDRDFFLGEVKLRNRIPATNDVASSLLKRAEKAEAESAALNAEIERLTEERQVLLGHKDRNGNPRLTAEELQAFRKSHPKDSLALIAMAAWVNVRPDQLPKEMRAHNCPDTKIAWDRVARAILEVAEAEIARLTAERDQARAQIAAVIEMAVQAVKMTMKDSFDETTSWYEQRDIFQAIRSLTPADATEALNQMLAQAWDEGLGAGYDSERSEDNPYGKNGGKST